MLRRLVDHAEVPHVVGLTLSPSQATGSAANRPGLEVVEQDWRDHKPTSGTIDYLGRCVRALRPKGLDPVKKLDAYREFFNFCDVCWSRREKYHCRQSAFSEPQRGSSAAGKDVPDSDLPLIWEPIAAAEGNLC